jgi:hypothetical protein
MASSICENGNRENDNGIKRGLLNVHSMTE